MVLAISIVIIQQLTFLSLLNESSYFTKMASADSRGIMFAVALFTAILSIPSFIWNFTLVRTERKRKNIAFAAVSVATFLFGIGYTVFAFVFRIHQLGLTLF